MAAVRKHLGTRMVDSSQTDLGGGVAGNHQTTV